MKEFLSGQLILLGIILIVGGIIIKSGLPLGKLPGDIHIEGNNFNFYFPLTTSILISVIISLILKILK